MAKKIKTNKKNEKPKDGGHFLPKMLTSAHA